MAKVWKCSKCGKPYRYGFFGSPFGKPEECDNCSHAEFEGPIIIGGFHEVIDEPRKVKDKVSRRQVLGSVGGGGALFGISYLMFGRVQVENTHIIALENTQFHPQNVEVELNAEVTWRNNDPSPYILENRTNNWDVEQEIEPDESWSNTFEEEGIYELGVIGPGLEGMRMQVGVATELDELIGGWF